MVEQSSPVRNDRLGTKLNFRSGERSRNEQASRFCDHMVPRRQHCFRRDSVEMAEYGLFDGKGLISSEFGQRCQSTMDIRHV
jgi:hypothetical protein